MGKPKYLKAQTIKENQKKTGQVINNATLVISKTEILKNSNLVLMYTLHQNGDQDYNYNVNQIIMKQIVCYQKVLKFLFVLFFHLVPFADDNPRKW